MENFQIKNVDIFHISAQNIDRGNSLEPVEVVLTSTHNLHLYVFSKIRKIMYTPVNSSWGLRGVKII